MNLFRRDLAYYYKKIRGVMIFLNIFYILLILLAVINGGELSIVDYFFTFLLVDSGFIVNYDEFFIPIFWLIIHVLPSVSLLIIVIYDHYINGINVLMKAKNKRKYFYAIFTSTAIINILLIAPLVILIIFLSIFRNSIVIGDLIFLLRILMCIIIENIILTGFSVLLSLYLSTIVSIFGILLILSLSILTNFSFILGQGSLVYRQDYMGGIYSSTQSLTILIIYLIFLMIISYVYLPNYNYYGDEK